MTAWYESAAVMARDLLLVGPDLSLAEAAQMMSQALGQTCPASHEAAPSAEISGASSCALVVRQRRLVGILTEQDLLRGAAEGLDLGRARVGEFMTPEPRVLAAESGGDVFEILALFREHRIRHLPVVQKDGIPVGLISLASLRQSLRAVDLLRFRRLFEVMDREVCVVPARLPLNKVARLMLAMGSDCMVVSDSVWAAQRLSLDPTRPLLPRGLIRERDIVQYQALELDLGLLTAEQASSRPLLDLQPDASLWQAHLQMQERHMTHGLVVNGSGLLQGVLSQRHFVSLLDPVEMFDVISTLHQQVQELRQERDQLRARLVPDPDGAIAPD
jgi:CBS domain-containing protein